MEYFNLILQHPILTIIVLIVLFIIKKDKFNFLLPSTEKKLDKLLQSKKRTKKLKDPVLEDFLHNEIEKHNFVNVTGLNLSEKNKKLLSLYKPLNKLLSWKEFKDISKNITNYEEYELINIKKLKFKYYIKIGWYLFLTLLLSIIIITIVKVQGKITISELEAIILFYIGIAFTYFLFVKERQKFKNLKRYNSIISEQDFIKKKTPKKKQTKPSYEQEKMSQNS